MHIATEDLKQLILGSRLVGLEALTRAVNEAVKAKRDVSEALVETGIISEAFLVDLLAQYFNVPKADLHSKPIPPEALQLLPESYAKAHNVVAFGLGSDEAGQQYVQIAMRDPGDLETRSYVENKLSIPARVAIASLSELDEAFRQYRFGIASEFSQEIETKLKEFSAAGQEQDLAQLATALPVVSIIERILEHAVSLRASDIHFEPFEEFFLIRYRVDGVLRDVLILPGSVAPIFVARVKVLANLRVDEHLAPQDGRFTFQMERERIDVRVSIVPVFWGEKTVMRLLRSSVRLTSLQALGFGDSGQQALAEEMQRSHGMMLVTGPTGSGKTTTLYAVLQLLNRPGVNISTIEDPAEYTIPRVNQTQVNVQAGMTFATGLRAFLRQDPDILMVGEIRDTETTELAIHAALTGHLVLSTLHTNDAPTAIPRLIDLGGAPFLLASTLNVIIAQRLVRKVCEHCVTSRAPTAAEDQALREQLRLLDIPRKLVMPKFLYRGSGCASCGGTGYQGRTVIFEILPVSEAIRALILENASVAKIRATAFQEGMITMFEDGVEKAERGVTTLEEVLRVVRE
ncbi:MAG: hypothetical protein A2682_03320 [Candidatus Terrybacteria bacterium RIFCSPHIGHO2_01_FULL_58_15]|uniref:Bacterial type II secretion system protein E domain-containing protein n=2 Tax=Candidatus Terryibacteriota TaxID=1817920 RepID=A0A1G2PPC3_TERXR|nr:MAG: hypothetical protein A2682_03320 [Candidatus Terrybacteria bacterium RIFCSPHIGHO2_01_FULL_58_15]